MIISLLSLLTFLRIDLNSCHKPFIERWILADYVNTFFLEGSRIVILSFFVMRQSKFIDQVSKVMVRFALKSFSIAIDSFLEVANSFFCLCFLKAFIADRQISATCLVVILLHHFITIIVL